MKIGVLEWDISALGGRQRTMMAFADFFIELGHEVTFYSDFLSPDGDWTDSSFLEWFPFKHLDYRHIVWSGLQRDGWNVPESMRQLDVLLVPYGGFGYLQEQLPNTRVIAWVIHPGQRRHDACREVWTNSERTQRKLWSSKRWMRSSPKVIRPPHDYSLFRSCANPPADRLIDVVIVGSALWAKGLVRAAELCRGLGLDTVVIAATWKAAEEENAEVLANLRLLAELRPGLGRGRLLLLTNQRAESVAALMGNSRACLSMSDAESCSLSIYEALSAGCNVVARKVGAAEEQCRGEGFLYRKDCEAKTALHAALDPRSEHQAKWKPPTWFDRGDEKVRADIVDALEGAGK